MKPVMLYAIIAIAAIAIVAGFKFQLGDMTMPPMSEELASNVLFVCPMENNKPFFILYMFPFVFVLYHIFRVACNF